MSSFYAHRRKYGRNQEGEKPGGNPTSFHSPGARIITKKETNRLRWGFFKEVTEVELTCSVRRCPYWDNSKGNRGVPAFKKKALVGTEETGTGGGGLSPSKGFPKGISGGEEKEKKIKATAVPRIGESRGGGWGAGETWRECRKKNIGLKGNSHNALKGRPEERCERGDTGCRTEGAPRRKPNV